MSSSTKYSSDYSKKPSRIFESKYVLNMRMKFYKINTLYASVLKKVTHVPQFLRCE